MRRAVPGVAKRSKPRSASRWASSVAAGLSRSQTERNATGAVAVRPRRQRAGPRRAWPWRRSSRSRARCAMTSPVERISGPSTGSEPGKRANGSTTSLTATTRGSGMTHVHLGEARAGGHAAGQVDEVDAHRLAHERHRAARARVGLEHVDRALVQRELHVDRGRCTPSAAHEQLGLAADLRLELRADRERRDHAGRVAGVHAGLLDVLHHGADDARPRRRRPRRRRPRSRPRRSGRRACWARPAPERSVVGVVADAHRPAAEHVARPHEHRVADALGAPRRPPRRRPRSPSRAPRRPSSREQVAEALAVLGEVDRGAGCVPRIGTPASISRRASRSGVWPPNCTTTPTGCSRSTTSSTSSTVSGSKYRRSAVS